MTGTRTLQTRGCGPLMRSHRRVVEPLQAVAPGPVQAVVPTCFRCHSPVRLYTQTTL
jgi:hypothetical protein